MKAEVKGEWAAKGKQVRLWFCVYPDGTRKMCFGEDVARELAQKYNNKDDDHHG